MSSPVHLETPSAARCAEFLAAVARSRKLHRGFAAPPTDSASYANWLRRLAEERYEGHFVVATTEDALAGVINLNEIVRGSFQSAYLGYYALAPFAGRGLMRAGLARVVRRAFGELRLHRLEANIQPQNLASLGLVRSQGFVREGYSPGYLKVGGRWRDHERWALVRGSRRAVSA